ncbi:hypothetical protein [Photobacterium damselae]|uniref:hypothetical protein n=1 Tax=Photobacterium damselae TaxID=38293 RepID=UPI000D6632E3|nr:hypothetical protein [Photobacterium damselae]AWK84143.1 hypothetical protein BST98_19390 [Photobacterium damselae]
MKNLFLYAFLSFVFYCQCSYADLNDSILFQFKAEITKDSLFYSITDVRLSPDDLELKYNDDNKKFDDYNLTLEVKTNIIKGSINNYMYSLSILDQLSYCTTFNNIVESYKDPIISINIDGNEKSLSDVPVSIDFSNEYSDGISSYLSDNRIINVVFFEPQPEKLIKDFKYCEGNFTLLAGLDI